MGTLPTGTVTFLFTDIEGSTKLWEKYPEAMKSALAKHDVILKNAVESNNGHIIKNTGDGIHAVFSTALDSVKAALYAQREIKTSEFLKNSEVAILVRMGIHTGEAELRDGDYYGGTLNRAARIMSIGHGGQILISETTLQVAREHFPEEVSSLDLGMHFLKGLNRPEHIYQLNGSGLQQEFPPLRSLTHATNNLPAQLTSFIGRERELAEAKSRLEDARLLTLIGPGGTGKTRLSIQLGRQLLSTFKDGVWLVEFAPISDPSLVMQTIASALDVREVPGTPLKVLVHEFLREKHLLIILDNCEHLVEASAKLADEILHIAPSIKIIASSREALGINGETVYRVPSLSLPNQDEVTKDAAMDFESVQLFVERASAANPKFHLTDENASSVAQICFRLDGIPLAIELSASRITAFSPEQIAKRLDDRFKLLTGGSRTALPRQQTLRALIDWSYDLLSEDERALLRRLSVFAGGWTFEAAETICSNVDVFEYLPQLINKSLVVMNDKGDEPRYYLLETIRQYARDKLLDAGEGEGTRNRHLDYYLDLAETADEYMLTSMANKWANQLEIELDNIRTAIEWGMSNDIESALRVAGALVYFWLTKSHELEGLRLLADALARSERLREQQENLSNQQIRNRAKALSAIAIVSYSQGQHTEVNTSAKEAVALWRQIGEKRYLAVMLSYLAMSNIYLGNGAEALTVKDEALALARESNDKLYLAATLGITVQVAAVVQGDFKTARAYSEEAIAILRENGNPWFVGISLFGMGMMEIQQGNFEEARSKFLSAKTYMLDVGDKHRINMINSELAHIERYEGHYQQAGVLYKETLREWQRIGHRAAIAHQLESIAFIAKALEQAERSAQLLGAAEALREEIGTDMTPQEREQYNKDVADLKANMDEKEFTSLWADGRSMTMEQAVEVALASGEEGRG